MIVADENYGRTIPFAFLQQVSEEFNAKFIEKAQNAAANSLDKSFGFIILIFCYFLFCPNKDFLDLV